MIQITKSGDSSMHYSSLLWKGKSRDAVRENQSGSFRSLVSSSFPSGEYAKEKLCLAAKKPLESY